jgi:hypothetical protein
MDFLMQGLKIKQLIFKNLETYQNSLCNLEKIFFFKRNKKKL